MKIPDPWSELRRHTAARIALGHAGGSLPTKALLDFQLSHARARDAVHHVVDFEKLRDRIKNDINLETVTIASAAEDKAAYLRRPDLGGILCAKSRTLLGQIRDRCQPDVLLILGDGLSGFATEGNGPPMLAALLPMLCKRRWRIAPLLLARNARVALQDECGEILGARLSVMLIGERPGLAVSDSLAAYFTWAPVKGRNNAERNCISNIRENGLPPGQAARRLVHLLEKAFQMQLSGIALKDDSPLLEEPPEFCSIEDI
jgi:ethanolamine ammonia-lyase small subunit